MGVSITVQEEPCSCDVLIGWFYTFTRSDTLTAHYCGFPCSSKACNSISNKKTGSFTQSNNLHACCVRERMLHMLMQCACFNQSATLSVEFNDADAAQ